MNNVIEKLRRAETKYLTVDSYINSISGFNSNSFDTWIKFFEKRGLLAKDTVANEYVLFPVGCFYFNL